MKSIGYKVLILVLVILTTFILTLSYKHNIIKTEIAIECHNTMKQQEIKEQTVKDKVRAIMAWHKSDSLEVYEALLDTFNPVVMACLISQESKFNPNAISHAQAIGICQVLRIHFKKEENPFNVTTNIKVGAALLKEYWDYFEGDKDQVSLALASYNAGFPLVKKLGRVPDIQETKLYVMAIDKKLQKANEL